MKSARWALVALAALCGLGAWDPIASPAGRYSGEIVTTYPQGKLRSGTGEALVRLDTGTTVLAEVPAAHGFPCDPGTPVPVTAFSSLLLGRMTYAAQVRR